MIPLGWIDSGLRSGAENLAIDRYWLYQCGQHELPGLLRFYRSTPCASLGCDQAIDRELRIDYCQRKRIPMLRRITGGSALYIDSDQCAFSLILPHASLPHTRLETVLQRACNAIAHALRPFGVAASFKFPNDLEVDGRKIASLFAAHDNHVIYLHGQLLLDADIQTMLEALRAPTEKLSPDGLAAARHRLATLRELCPALPSAETLRDALAASLANLFDLSLYPAGAEAVEELIGADAVAREAQHAFSIDWQDSSNSYLEAFWQTPGGLLRARMRPGQNPQQTPRIEFAAAVQAAPPHLFAQLAAALKDLPLAQIEPAVWHFLNTQQLEIPGIAAQDFTHLLGLLLDKHTSLHALKLSPREASAMMPFTPQRQPTQAILKTSTVMLVPYCAKPAWCKLRHEDDCTECGLCEVSEAYRLARERGMRVTTITRYEHLLETLGEMQADGVSAYVGMCCSHFFIKRQRAFQEANIPGVLMDISGANCYELQQEDQAYAGTFQAQATLDVPLLQRLMEFVPASNLQPTSPQLSLSP